MTPHHLHGATYAAREATRSEAARLRAYVLPLATVLDLLQRGVALRESVPWRLRATFSAKVSARHCTGGIVGRATSSQYLADLPLAVSAGYANHAGSCDRLVAALRRTIVLFRGSSVRTGYKQCAAGKKSKHGDLRDAQALLLAHRLQSHKCFSV